MIVRDDWLVSETPFTNCLRRGTSTSMTYPMNRVLDSRLNAELVFRGSSVEASSRFRIPVVARQDLNAAILRHCFRIQAINSEAAINRSRILWGKMLYGGEPSSVEAAERITNFKFVMVRDRLLAYIPGVDLSHLRPAPRARQTEYPLSARRPCLRSARPALHAH